MDAALPRIHHRPLQEPAELRRARASTTPSSSTATPSAAMSSACTSGSTATASRTFASTARAARSRRRPLDHLGRAEGQDRPRDRRARPPLRRRRDRARALPHPAQMRPAGIEGRAGRAARDGGVAAGTEDEAVDVSPEEAARLQRDLRYSERALEFLLGKSEYDRTTKTTIEICPADELPPRRLAHRRGGRPQDRRLQRRRRALRDRGPLLARRRAARRRAVRPRGRLSNVRDTGRCSTLRPAGRRRFRPTCPLILFPSASRTA